MASIVDKTGMLSSGLPSPLVLELGCGNRKREAFSVGIDQIDFSCVDIVGDVFDVLGKLPDKSVDRVVSHHFFEHLEGFTGLVVELSRLLKKGGTLEVVVPHFSNPYFYSDPTHKTHFGLYTFCYFTHRHAFSRTVPTYDITCPFEIVSVDLIFKSPRPFYVRYALKRIVGVLFNSSTFMREFWEENLCYLFPCYEVVYKIRVV